MLTTGRLRMRFAERSTARRALKAKAGRAVAPVISFRAASLSAFAQRTEQVTRRFGRNASMRITVRRIIGRKARYGSKISAARLDKAIRRRMADPALGRGLAPKVFRVRPAVRLIDLRRRNRTILTIDRGGHRLRLFKRLRYDRWYGIAVGAAGTETPPGPVPDPEQAGQPAVDRPNRPWAGCYAGRTVPGGAPDNPLKARWLGIAGGVGIHGTSEAWSIGSSASHGCIRMRVPDVIDLFGRVPVGVAGADPLTFLRPSRSTRPLRQVVTPRPSRPGQLGRDGERAPARRPVDWPPRRRRDAVVRPWGACRCRAPSPTGPSLSLAGLKRNVPRSVSPSSQRAS